MTLHRLPRRMRRRDWLIFALLIAGALAWHLLFPRPLREVARFPNTVDARLTPQGVLCITSLSQRAVHLTQYENTGKRLWSVPVKVQDWMYGDYNDAPIYAVSPDGHLLATMEWEGDKPTVRTYRDGALAATAVLPWCNTIPHPTVLDNGQVWVQPRRSKTNTDPQKTTFHVCLVQGEKVLTGGYQVRTPLPPGYDNSAMLSPDGTMLFVFTEDAITAPTVEVVALRADARRVVCEHRYTIKNKRIMKYLPGRRFITNDGAVYDLHRKVIPHIPGWSLDEGGRIWNYATGESWVVPKQVSLNSEDHAKSIDSRFVAGLTPRYDPHPVSKTIQDWTSRLPLVGERLRAFVWRHSQHRRAALSVYERPGTLRARRIIRINWQGDACTSEEADRALTISPTGRHILFADKAMHLNEREFILYRW